MSNDIPFNVFALNEDETIKFRNYWAIERNMEIIFIPFHFLGYTHNAKEPELLFSMAISQFQKDVIWK